MGSGASFPYSISCLSSFFSPNDGHLPVRSLDPRCAEELTAPAIEQGEHRSSSEDGQARCRMSVPLPICVPFHCGIWEGREASKQPLMITSPTYYALSTPMPRILAASDAI